ncbi:mandelate racemase/muconate lactonizing enzyme family protein [Escherichia coli]|uniref:mandelate racemase/muconate lactonizing enzyme family protein n=1 Tax=Escherichia coli TaxID=562 RepID=UPI000E679966|nr:mandelate racemase/muconate lactonizing enzyme family protein [Escherichia coli]MCB3584249.1 mandelate racemase/muconate lactonizing enzyme family protein [Klebsiella pneumoniae]MCB3612283.1 mandelate racemase/muconate lactonizing enzyme family protein [Klebsiella pneumoniae]RIW06389.1 mandelate racemase/muconate lactonizing enzyme family protein [Escherichia coli]
MKVTGVTTHLLTAKLSQPFSYSRARYDTRTAMLVEIETDEGISGWGECYGPARMTRAVVDELGSMIIGSDPLNVEYLWADLYSRLRDHGQKGLLIEGLSGIDIALWDIRGKYFGVPSWQLLGGRMRSEVQAYATGLYRRDRGTPVQYLVEEALSYVEQGFTAMKLKVGFGVEEDYNVTCAIREAIGPDIMLMVDANHAYDAVAAIQLARRIEQFDISWFEEPVPPEDLDGYIRVKAATTIPLAGGECEFTRYGFKNVLTAGAMDIIQPDICAAGGLTECKKISDMAQTFGIRTNPHVWGSGVGIAASLQWIAMVPTHTPISLSPSQPLLEFDQTEHPVRQAILQTPVTHQRGIVTVPTEPGLGIEINRDALEFFKQ